MSGLILPPGFNKRTTPKKPKVVGSNNFTVKNMEVRARFWHDYQYPGDVAAAIVNAKREGKPSPVREPERCPNRDCRVCNPSQEDMDRLQRGHHIQ